MGKLRRVTVFSLVVTMLINGIMVPSPALASGFKNPFRKRTSIERLAAEIDKLERHLNEFGTVVAKQPDVWGEARLTSYRTEFETQMKGEASRFDAVLSASRSQRDSAFLANALVLQSLNSSTPPIGGGDDPPGDDPPDQPAPPAQSAPTATPFSSLLSNLISDPLAPAADATPALIPRSNNPVLSDTNIFGLRRDRTDDNKLIDMGNSGIRIEPTVYLDQKKRYLDHLHAIRRVNEGDDTADSPGYALHLVRIPISVLPGKKTREGYGAEISISVEPHLSDELLPKTFRDLVINDLVDLLALPIAKVVNEVDIDSLEKALNEYRNPNADEGKEETNDAKEDGSQEVTLWTLAKMYGENAERFADAVSNQDKGDENLETIEEAMQSSRGGSALRHGKLPIAPSLMNDVFGRGHVLAQVAVDAYRNLHATFHSDNQPIHLGDLKSYLRSELETSYDFLNSESKFANQRKRSSLWRRHATQHLADVITEHRRFHKEPSSPNLVGLRGYFFETLNRELPAVKFTTTASLAWAIVVESALLNQQLLHDMKELASIKNCECMPFGNLSFVGPNPAPEARYAFNEYVKCRWPIKVFALDPVTQDQNVADSASRRREFQLALALALANGDLSAQNVTRFVRRIETDLETVDLNRTVVGFSHGNDTFGWRFQPRVQVPPIESNLKTAFSELLIGGPKRDSDINSHRLEPGIRQCTAIIVMPSFVPYALFDVRSNWFKLTNPKKRLADLEDAVELSKGIQSMHSLADTCRSEESLYRSGEVHRLLRAVDRLDRSLPLQSSYVQMPYENTLGGFEMFNSGVTDLAPQLDGWYGAPGVHLAQSSKTRQDVVKLLYDALRQLASAELEDDSTAIDEARNKIDEYRARLELLDRESTELYVVGKNINIIDSRVIAGGIDVTDSVKIISKQVMQIAVPSSARFVYKICLCSSDHSIRRQQPFVDSNHQFERRCRTCKKSREA